LYRGRTIVYLTDGMAQPISVQSHLFSSPTGAQTLMVPVPYPPPSVEGYTRIPSQRPLLLDRKGSDHLPRSGDLVVPRLSACGCEGWGRLVSPHQQQATGGQLVTVSLVPGTGDSDVALECHLYCPPPWSTGKMSSVDGS